MCEPLCLYEHGSSKILQHCYLLVAMSTLTQAPSATILTPGTPCSICHLDVGRDSLQCSACLKWVHFLCSFLTRADFCTICATGTAVGWRCPACHPQKKTGSHHSDQSPCYAACVPSPSPQGSPHYRLAFITHVHLGASHVTLAPFALSR